MSHKVLHVYSQKRQNEIHTLAAFVPIIVFVLLLAFFFSKLPRKEVSQSQYTPTVLGEENEVK